VPVVTQVDVTDEAVTPPLPKTAGTTVVPAPAKPAEPPVNALPPRLPAPVPAPVPAPAPAPAPATAPAAELPWSQVIPDKPEAARNGRLRRRVISRART
jgi:hypothetical protein